MIEEKNEAPAPKAPKIQKVFAEDAIAKTSNYVRLGLI